MATTEPLTGATIYQQTDTASTGQHLGDVVTDLAPYTVPRFATTSARDTAFSAFVAAGGTIANGMTCWCDSPGSYYERQSGAWVPRARVIYQDNALDGSSVPAGARLVRLRRSYTTTVGNTGGGFNVPFGFGFTKLMAVALWPGDDVGPLGFIVPVGRNHTLSTGHGVAYQPNGTYVPNGQLIRVEVDVVGYIL